MGPVDRLSFAGGIRVTDTAATASLTDLQEAVVAPFVVVLEGIEHHHLSLGPARQALCHACPFLPFCCLYQQLVDGMCDWQLLHSL